MAKRIARTMVMKMASKAVKSDPDETRDKEHTSDEVQQAHRDQRWRDDEGCVHADTKRPALLTVRMPRLMKPMTRSMAFLESTHRMR